MALVLTLRVGADFWVGTSQFFLDEIISREEVIVLRAKDGAKFRLTDRRSVEILPQVLASVGDRGQLEIARVAITAPRTIPIGRDAPTLPKGA